MSGTAGVILFVVLFVGVVAWMILSGSKGQKLWAARPAVLRSLAERRGYQFAEQPGKPADLAPIRPVEPKGETARVELPAAVRGRSLDSDLTLFDVRTQTTYHVGSQLTSKDSYETLLTIRSEAKWPHFEFLAISNSKADSLEGKLLAGIGNVGESTMKSRGLTHVPIEGRPGYQLYVGETESAGTVRDALMHLFDNRTGWWVGALDDMMTFSRSLLPTQSTSGLVPSEDLERFMDEAVEIERRLRGEIATRP